MSVYFFRHYKEIYAKEFNVFFFFFFLRFYGCISVLVLNKNYF
jgi:hypothetical protein